MITNAGKNHIRRYLAEYVPSIAKGMGFGVGARTETGSDFGLQLEVIRTEIKSKTYDFANNKIIYRATVPVEWSGRIYEVGIYSMYQDPKSTVSGTKLISDINEAEGWVNSGTTTNSAFTTDTTTARTFPRLGTSGVFQNPAASGTANDSLNNVHLDLSKYSNSDFITIAVNAGNAFATSLTIRFMTDASNYYTFTVSSGINSSGYKILDFLKGSAVVTGSPDWANITEVKISTTSTAGGTSAITWDGIMVQDTDSTNLDYTLVARKVLPTPVTAEVNQSQDIEFTLDIVI